MNPSQLEHKDYLGDGLYAGFDGYQVILWAEREDGIHYVALEDHVISAFQRYLYNLKAAVPK